MSENTRLRISTWNLERPKAASYKKNSIRIEKLREINADIFVLTETHAAITLNTYSSLASISDTKHGEGESYSSILSRWPILQQIPTHDPVYTVCAEIDTPDSPIIVYGTIITYANDGVSSGTAKRWEKHRLSIERHAADWLRIRKQFPDHLFCVAGDFNQSRDGSGWYEDKQSIKMLTAALSDAGIVCVTECDMRATGLLKTRASIDHICFSTSPSVRVTRLGAWEGTTPDGLRMSDHNGVVVDIEVV